MDLDAFWELLARSASESTLTAELATLPLDSIASFQMHLDRQRSRVDTWDHWAAGSVICAGLCSDDGFFYFQAWLIGLGRATFEQVALSPDALASVPEVRRLAQLGEIDMWSDDDWPDWEALDYVADEAFTQASGDPDGLAAALEARGWSSHSSPDPSGTCWDFDDPAEVARRLPRLADLFLSGEKVA